MEVFERNINPNYSLNEFQDEEERTAVRKAKMESVKEYSDITSIDIYQIGATVGVHTGPYPLGVGLLKKYDA